MADVSAHVKSGADEGYWPLAFVSARFRMSHVLPSCLKLSMFCAHFHIKLVIFTVVQNF